MIVSIAQGHAGKIFDAKGNCLTDEDHIMECNLISGKATKSVITRPSKLTGMKYFKLATETTTYQHIPLTYEPSEHEQCIQCSQTVHVNNRIISEDGTYTCSRCKGLK